MLVSRSATFLWHSFSNFSIRVTILLTSVNEYVRSEMRVFASNYQIFMSIFAVSFPLPLNLFLMKSLLFTLPRLFLIPSALSSTSLIRLARSKCSYFKSYLTFSITPASFGYDLWISALNYAASLKFFESSSGLTIFSFDFSPYFAFPSNYFNAPYIAGACVPLKSSFSAVKLARTS